VLSPQINCESSDLFFFKQPPAASRNSYVSETNVVAKGHRLYTINRIPSIAQAKPVEINITICFPPIPGDYPLSNGQLGLIQAYLGYYVASKLRFFTVTAESERCGRRCMYRMTWPVQDATDREHKI
jgi:hypothetical protein